ncbi:MAG: hypothetical protein HS104_26515 [Polyangiaceae bacterium]|nr:hypothetical protein [Polyangiaceae bacterium]MCE7888842.1 hypothetical protein [Sorangiineae bacterium PRO1]MCL4750194.1 hypothetical protein [Myxococcales bacterium]
MAAPQNPSSKAADASLDAIPMKKSNPMVLFGIIGAVLLVGGVIVFKSIGDKPKKTAAVAASTDDPLAGMSVEERKRHIEITRKSLEVVAAKQAEEDAKKKAAEEAKKAEEEAKPSGGGGPAPAAGGGGDPTPVAAKAPSDDPPKKKAPTVAEKKKMDDLDKLGSDISGKLGK